MTLQFWHPSLDEAVPTTWFAWGTVPRGTSDDIAFRISNSDTVYNAVAVVVSIVDPGSAGNPNAASQHYLSLDGNVFTASVTLDVAAGTLTPLIWLRRVTPSTATIGGPYPFQLRVTATSWA